MDQEGNYITEEKKKALETELAELKGPKRKEILDVLQYAKSLGDLAENANTIRRGRSRASWNPAFRK